MIVIIKGQNIGFRVGLSTRNQREGKDQNRMRKGSLGEPKVLLLLKGRFRRSK